MIDSWPTELRKGFLEAQSARETVKDFNCPRVEENLSPSERLSRWENAKAGFQVLANQLGSKLSASTDQIATWPEEYQLRFYELLAKDPSLQSTMRQLQDDRMEEGRADLSDEISRVTNWIASFQLPIGEGSQGTGWRRVTATAAQAVEFHQNFKPTQTGYAEVKIGKHGWRPRDTRSILNTPLRINLAAFKKAQVWVDLHSSDLHLETHGHFVLDTQPDGTFVIEDFIPQPSINADAWLSSNYHNTPMRVASQDIERPGLLKQMFVAGEIGSTANEKSLIPAPEGKRLASWHSHPLHWASGADRPSYGDFITHPSGLDRFAFVWTPKNGHYLYIPSFHEGLTHTLSSNDYYAATPEALEKQGLFQRIAPIASDDGSPQGDQSKRGRAAYSVVAGIGTGDAALGANLRSSSAQTAKSEKPAATKQIPQSGKSKEMKAHLGAREPSSPPENLGGVGAVALGVVAAAAAIRNRGRGKMGQVAAVQPKIRTQTISDLPINAVSQGLKNHEISEAIRDFCEKNLAHLESEKSVLEGNLKEAYRHTLEQLQEGKISVKEAKERSLDIFQEDYLVKLVVRCGARVRQLSLKEYVSELRGRGVEVTEWLSQYADEHPDLVVRDVVIKNDELTDSDFQKGVTFLYTMLGDFTRTLKLPAYSLVYHSSKDFKDLNYVFLPSALLIDAPEKVYGEKAVGSQITSEISPREEVVEFLSEDKRTFLFSPLPQKIHKVKNADPLINVYHELTHIFIMSERAPEPFHRVDTAAIDRCMESLPPELLQHISQEVRDELIEVTYQRQGDDYYYELFTRISREARPPVEVVSALYRQLKLEFTEEHPRRELILKKYRTVFSFYIAYKMGEGVDISRFFEDEAETTLSPRPVDLTSNRTLQNDKGSSAAYGVAATTVGVGAWGMNLKKSSADELRRTEKPAATKQNTQSEKSQNMTAHVGARAPSSPPENIGGVGAVALGIVGAVAAIRRRGRGNGRQISSAKPTPTVRKAAPEVLPSSGEISKPKAVGAAEKNSDQQVAPIANTSSVQKNLQSIKAQTINTLNALTEGFLFPRDQRLLSQMMGWVVDPMFRARVDSLSPKEQKVELLKNIDASEYLDEIGNIQEGLSQATLDDHPVCKRYIPPLRELLGRISQDRRMSLHDFIQVAYLYQNALLTRFEGFHLVNDPFQDRRFFEAIPYRLFIPTSQSLSLMDITIMALACVCRVFHGDMVPPGKSISFDGMNLGKDLFRHDLQDHFYGLAKSLDPRHDGPLSPLPTPEQVIDSLKDMEQVRGFVETISRATQQSSLDRKMMFLFLFDLVHEQSDENDIPHAYQTLSHWRRKLGERMSKGGMVDYFHFRIHRKAEEDGKPNDFGTSFDPEDLQFLTKEKIQSALSSFKALLDLPTTRGKTAYSIVAAIGTGVAAYGVKLGSSRADEGKAKQPAVTKQKPQSDKSQNTSAHLGVREPSSPPENLGGVGTVALGIVAAAAVIRSRGRGKIKQVSSDQPNKQTENITDRSRTTQAVSAEKSKPTGFLTSKSTLDNCLQDLGEIRRELAADPLRKSPAHAEETDKALVTRLAKIENYLSTLKKYEDLENAEVKSRLEFILKDLRGLQSDIKDNLLFATRSLIHDLTDSIERKLGAIKKANSPYLFEVNGSIPNRERMSALLGRAEKIIVEEDDSQDPDVFYNEIGNNPGFKTVKSRSSFPDRTFCQDYLFNHLHQETWPEIKKPFSRLWYTPITFLKEKGYELVDPKDRREGDVVAYLGNDSESDHFDKEIPQMRVRHWGRYRGNDRVQSKFNRGPVFEHGIQDVPDIYGNQVLFFRKSKSLPGKALLAREAARETPASGVSASQVSRTPRFSEEGVAQTTQNFRLVNGSEAISVDDPQLLLRFPTDHVDLNPFSNEEGRFNFIVGKSDYAKEVLIRKGVTSLPKGRATFISMTDFSKDASSELKELQKVLGTEAKVGMAVLGDGALVSDMRFMNLFSCAQMDGKLYRVLTPNPEKWGPELIQSDEALERELNKVFLPSKVKTIHGKRYIFNPLLENVEHPSTITKEEYEDLIARLKDSKVRVDTRDMRTIEPGMEPEPDDNLIRHQGRLYFLDAGDVFYGNFEKNPPAEDVQTRYAEELLSKKVRGQSVSVTHPSPPPGINADDAADPAKTWTKQVIQVQLNGSSYLPKDIQSTLQRIIDKSEETGHEYAMLAFQVGDKIYHYKVGATGQVGILTSRHPKIVKGEDYQRAHDYILKDLKGQVSQLGNQPIKIYMLHTHPFSEDTFTKTSVYTHEDGQAYTHFSPEDYEGAQNLLKVATQYLQSVGYQRSIEIVAGAVATGKEPIGTDNKNPYISIYESGKVRGANEIRKKEIGKGAEQISAAAREDVKSPIEKKESPLDATQIAEKVFAGAVAVGTLTGFDGGDWMAIGAGALFLGGCALVGAIRLNRRVRTDQKKPTSISNERPRADQKRSTSISNDITLMFSPEVGRKLLIPKGQTRSEEILFGVSSECEVPLSPGAVSNRFPDQVRSLDAVSGKHFGIFRSEYGRIFIRNHSRNNLVYLKRLGDENLISIPRASENPSKPFEIVSGTMIVLKQRGQSLNILSYEDIQKLLPLDEVSSSQFRETLPSSEQVRVAAKVKEHFDSFRALNQAGTTGNKSDRRCSDLTIGESEEGNVVDARRDTGRLFDVHSWQRVRYGPLLYTKRELTYTGYVMIHSSDIPEGIEILKKIALRRASANKSTDFKWLVATDPTLNGIVDSQGTVKYGHYSGKDPTMPAIAIYGDSLEEVQGVLYLLGRDSGWVKIERNRNQKFKATVQQQDPTFAKNVRQAPRRPGTHAYKGKNHKGETVEWASLNYNEQPGFSEDEARIGWREKKGGASTYLGQKLVPGTRGSSVVAIGAGAAAYGVKLQSSKADTGETLLPSAKPAQTTAHLGAREPISPPENIGVEGAVTLGLVAAAAAMRSRGRGKLRQVSPTKSQSIDKNATAKNLPSSEEVSNPKTAAALGKEDSDQPIAPSKKQIEPEAIVEIEVLGVPASPDDMFQLRIARWDQEPGFSRALHQAATETAKSLQANRSMTLRNALENIANVRMRLGLENDPKNKVFGVLRKKGPTTVTEMNIADKPGNLYKDLLKPIFQSIEKNYSEYKVNVDRSDSSDPRYRKDFVHLEEELPGHFEKTPLTYIEAFSSNGELHTIIFRHPNVETLDEIISSIEPIFETLKNRSLSPQEVIQKVAELHFWLAHAMPYQRGSAATTDALTKSILMYHGITPGRWKPNFSPDIHAFVTPKDQFVKDYATFFEMETGARHARKFLKFNSF